MKTLIAAALLLASTSAFAASANPHDLKLIEDWRDADFSCYNSVRTGSGIPGDKPCTEVISLEKQLTAKGYCIYGLGRVGRSSKDRKHCYELDNLPAL